VAEQLETGRLPWPQSSADTSGPCLLTLHHPAWGLWLGWRGNLGLHNWFNSADMAYILTYPFHFIRIFPFEKGLEAKGFFPMYFHIVTESFTGHPSVSKGFNLNIRNCCKTIFTLNIPSLENWRGQDGSWKSAAQQRIQRRTKPARAFRYTDPSCLKPHMQGKDRSLLWASHSSLAADARPAGTGTVGCTRPDPERAERWGQRFGNTGP